MATLGNNLKFKTLTITHLGHHVHSNMIRNSQEVKPKQLKCSSKNRWVGKEVVVYPCNGILFSCKKEGSSDICYNMRETWGHYAEWNKPITKRHIVWLQLCEIPRILRFIETESRMVVARSWDEGGTGESLFNGSRVSVLQDEKSSQDGWWWWLHNNVNVLNAESYA